MNKRTWAVATVFCLAGVPAGIVGAQQQPAESGAVIRTETKLVLVDAIVTDKKGAYIKDLTKKEFKVFEDNKEQEIKSFSFEADPNSPGANRPRYLVLFFDNSSMSAAGPGFAASYQMEARNAAMKFIDSNVAPNRLMSVVNYGGSLEVTQNFTDNADRLKAAVQGIRTSAVTTSTAGGGGPGGPQMSQAAASFGRYDMILALRNLAKGLAGVPGRKSLVLLTAGFPVNGELLQEVTATIDVCNKANVAIYPIDVRGLVANAAQDDDEALLRPIPSIFRTVAYAVPFQGRGGVGSGGGSPAPVGGGGSGGGRSPGGGGGGGRNPGGTSGSGSTGGKSPTGGASGTAGIVNMNPAARNLLPTFPPTATTNQELMYMLADGTGGFVILNTNDLLGGLEKIGQEQNEHYLLGYTPPESEEGTCHALKVKVDRGGTTVRARTGYCNSKNSDELKQTPVETTLESKVTSSQPGAFKAAMETAYFYTAPNVARVQLAMDIPVDAMKFDKEKGKQRATVNVLGIAYAQDGSVAARFSDAVKLDFNDKKDIDNFKQHPYHYENQFDIGAGQYNLKVAFSSGGESFGKIESPLKVGNYTFTTFALSTFALSNRVLKTTDPLASVETALLEDRTPLTYEGLQIIPAAQPRFKNDDKVAVYLEVYDPRLIKPDPAKPVALALQVKVLDTTGQVKQDSGAFRIKVPDQGGSPTVPFGGVVPVTGLAPGAYKLEITAVNDANETVRRTADFEIAADPFKQ